MGSNGRSPILLIDSDPTHLAKLEPVLRNLGETVICARSEQEALQRLGERRYSAVLFETHMPEMDSLAAALRIREQKDGGLVPILFLDADEADERRILHCRGIGRVDFVHHSFPPELLEAKVRLLLEITRQEEELQDLKRELQRLRLATDGFKDLASFWLDGRGIITEWSAQAERILGYPAAEVIGRDFSFLFTPEDRTREVPQRELSVAEGFGTTQTSHWHLKNDGTLLYMFGITSAVRDESGELSGFIAVRRDETRARQARDALCETEERYRLVAQATTDVIYDLDLKTNNILWNEAMKSVFGYTTGEFRADIDWWTGLVHPEDRERTVDSLQNAINGTSWHWEQEYRFRRSDGTWAMVYDQGQILRDANGRALRLIGSMIDVTRQRAAEEEMRLARDLAVEASMAKSQFLATMSHELRSPLTAILGYAELLEEELEEEGVPQLKPDLEKIHTAGEHLLAVISDILDLSKIEAGKLELRIEEFEVGEVMRQAVSAVQPQLDKSNMSLIMRSECENRMMRADQTRVRQVLINLLSNAVKFTSKGEIRLECRLDRFHGKREQFIFRIADTGIGMSPDQIARLFQKFQQLDSSSTRSYSGTGLGLAICRFLCDMMGGSIEVESEAGRGSVFTVSLPADMELLSGKMEK